MLILLENFWVKSDLPVEVEPGVVLKGLGKSVK